MGASDVLAYRSTLVSITITLTLLLSNCSDATVTRYEFHHTAPTVFTNEDGKVIKISTEGLLVGNHFFAASECSNKQYYCFVYGDDILIIAPKRCGTAPTTTWRIGQLEAKWNGYDQNVSADIVQTSFGNGIGYSFSEIPGRGVVGIAYDRTNDHHAVNREKIFATIPSNMLYFNPIGPAFLPCEKVTVSRVK